MNRSAVSPTDSRPGERSSLRRHVGRMLCVSGEEDGQSPQPGESSDGRSCSFEGKIIKMQKTMKRKCPELKVGIFSRSSECEYQWLKTRLESEKFKKTVKSVRPCLVTNGGSQQFHADVSWCKFGILYHSKNRGRINITDVTDSLYDEELQYLSRKLGRKNVIVVIDDLEDSGEEQKTRILESQPKLKTMAKEVFLFSKDEKQ